MNGPVADSNLLYGQCIQFFFIFVVHVNCCWWDFLSLDFICFVTEFGICDILFFVCFIYTYESKRTFGPPVIFPRCSDKMPVNGTVCGNPQEPSEALTAGLSSSPGC